MILDNGDNWEPEPGDILAWQRTYKTVDVYQELLSMESWCDANPSRRKTLVGVKRFVNNWLKGALKDGGSPWVKKTVVTTSLKAMTESMVLTDVSWVPLESKQLATEYFLEKYGQYYTEVTDPDTHKTTGELHYASQK